MPYDKQESLAVGDKAAGQSPAASRPDKRLFNAVELRLEHALSNQDARP